MKHLVVVLLLPLLSACGADATADPVSTRSYANTAVNNPGGGPAIAQHAVQR